MRDLYGHALLEHRGTSNSNICCICKSSDYRFFRSRNIVIIKTEANKRSIEMPTVSFLFFLYIFILLQCFLLLLLEIIKEREGYIFDMSSYRFKLGFFIYIYTLMEFLYFFNYTINCIYLLQYIC